MAARDPFREMEDLRREVDRVIEAWDSGRRPDVRRAVFLPGYGARQYPMVNLYDDKDNYYVEALAPGVDAQSLDVTVQSNTLSISGEKLSVEDVHAEAYHRSERSAGKFVRSFDLPGNIEGSRVSAEYNNGLLLVTIPKNEEAKSKQISIKVGK